MRNEGPMEWVTVITAPDQLSAELWQGLLKGEGIPAVVETPGGSFLGLSPMPCRLKVPEGLVGEARAVLAEYGVAEKEGPGGAFDKEGPGGAFDKDGV